MATNIRALYHSYGMDVDDGDSFLRSDAEGSFLELGATIFERRENDVGE